MARIMRSAVATLLLAALAHAQLPSLSPFPSPLPPFDTLPSTGGAAALEPMLPVNPPNTPLEPFAPPPGPVVPADVQPAFPGMAVSPEPVMMTMEPHGGMMMAPSAEPVMMMPSVEPSPALFVGGYSPEPSIATFMAMASPDMMMHSPEPSMGGMYMAGGPTTEPTMMPVFVSPAPGGGVLPIVTPPPARCPNTCRLSVGANAEFNIDSPQDESFSGAITGPNFVTALEVGEATVNGRPVSSYGLPATTFGIWPIGLTNKFGVGHRTVEMRDREKLYSKCVQIPITRYISGTTNPVLVNSMNSTVDCVSFYLTAKQPAAPVPV